MSNAGLNLAWAVRGLTGTEKVVLARLADRADASGVCYPGQTSLADDCCLTTRTVRDALGSLIEAQHLQVIVPATFSTPATYRVTPRTPEGASGGERGSGEENGSAPSGKSFRSPPEGNSGPLRKELPPNPQLTLIEPSVTLAPTSLAKAERPEKLRDSTPAPAKARERDPIFDALAVAEGSKAADLTKRASKAIGVAAAEIRKASPTVTPEEIARRAAIYPGVMPKGSTLTASALAKHWARCGDTNGKAPMDHAERLRRAVS